MSSSDVSGVSNGFFSTVAEGFVTTTAGSVTAGNTTVPLNSTSGLTTGNVFVGIVEPGVTGKEQTFTGTVDTSGSQVTGVVWTRGANVDHAAGVTVVDYVTGTHHNIMTKGMLIAHNQDGTHRNGATYSAAVLTNQPTITDFTNAHHTHANSAGGAQLTGSSALVNSTVTADKLATGAATASVLTSQTSASTSYTDLATAGPSVTVTIGANGLLLVIFSAQVSNSTAGGNVFMSFALSGTNTLASADINCSDFLPYANGGSGSNNNAILLSGLSAGSTTVKAQYKVGAGTGTWASRVISAIPL